MTPATLKATTKGEETRALILETAVRMASESGFESLTIGSLAERTGLSKSGLFAHFGSKLDLQIATLDEAARRFTESVFLPALKAPRGVKRLRALFEHWIDWPTSLNGGCPIDAATLEYDHKPGPMRDAVMDRHKLLARELAKTARLCVETGEFPAETDTDQFAFEFFGHILAFYRLELIVGPEAARKRAQAAFERMVAQTLATPAPAAAAAR